MYGKKEEKINARVEYESTPIRHIAVQCPQCKNWFYGDDISKRDIRFDYHLSFMDCSCPKCGYEFEGSAEVKECGHPEVYKNVLERKVSWE